MAESFAKLSLRTVVTEYDAALAISLYEENLVAMSTGNATANAYTGSHILHAVHKPHYSASFSALEVRTPKLSTPKMGPRIVSGLLQHCDT